MDSQIIIVVMGPSGCGKSTVIERLCAVSRFEAVPAYTTRPDRSCEPNRTCISQGYFRKLLRSDRLLLVNNLYGHWYGTPAEAIDQVLNRGKNPVLDCPVERVKEIRSRWPGLVRGVYLEPPSADVLRIRLSDGRDPAGLRFQAALDEITALHEGKYSLLVDQVIINSEGKLQEVVDRILKTLRCPDQGWTHRAFVLKNDRYRNARGGVAFICELRCAACDNPILIYQKDGRGGLHRCYLNRILAPAHLAALQVDARINVPADLPDLACGRCRSVIATPMRHGDGRLAFRLRHGSFRRKPIENPTNEGGNRRDPR